MEYMDLGSLESLQQKLGGTLPEEVLSRVAEEVGAGLSFDVGDGGAAVSAQAAEHDPSRHQAWEHPSEQQGGSLGGAVERRAK